MGLERSRAMPGRAEQGRAWTGFPARAVPLAPSQACRQRPADGAATIHLDQQLKA
jgi:hypothetical protein